MRTLVKVQSKRKGEYFIYPYYYTESFNPFCLFCSFEELDNELWLRGLVAV